MASKYDKTTKKIYPDFKTMALVVSCSGFLIILSAFGICLLENYFIRRTGVFNFNTLQIVILCILVAFTIFFIFYTKYRCYYTLTQNMLIYQKYFSKEDINYRDIVFIDDLRSKKEKRVYLYFKNGTEKILASDSKNSLLVQISLRCDNLLSRSEFLTKYPFVQLGTPRSGKRRK